MGDSPSQTTETFTENLKSVHYQVSVWKHMLDSDPSDMSQMNFGLLHEETIDHTRFVLSLRLSFKSRTNKDWSAFISHES